ncbi:hypothetical protein [Sphingopyxis flava]|uniref:hypothetical protein n=1 Tax=Sphingopyxis flava TaxID=1507287 RepID=UPI001FE9B31B|nr:hypothetical protein [Sphingopyxis flava]
MTMWLAECAIEIGADAIGAARIDRVARGAFCEDGFTLCRVGRRQEIGERDSRFAATRACVGVFDREARLFRIVARTQHAGADRQSKRANAREQDPPGNSIVAIVHACSPVRWRPRRGRMIGIGRSLTGARAAAQGDEVRSAQLHAADRAAMRRRAPQGRQIWAVIRLRRSGWSMK